MRIVISLFFSPTSPRWWILAQCNASHSIFPVRLPGVRVWPRGCCPFFSFVYFATFIKFENCGKCHRGPVIDLHRRWVRLALSRVCPTAVRSLLSSVFRGSSLGLYNCGCDTLGHLLLLRTMIKYWRELRAYPFVCVRKTN